jgi:hypothetical protein
MGFIVITTSSESSEKSCSISTATLNDLNRLGIMGHTFADLYGAGLMSFKTNVFLEKMQSFMRSGVGTVLCAHEGFELRGALAGVMYENVFDGERCATELFWYVWPGAARGTGSRLLDAFEEWARFRGATRVTMAYMLHNQPEQLAAFYEKRGYRPFETHYVKLI